MNKNEQVKLITSDPGYGSALRRGLEYATGEFFVIYNVDFYDKSLIDLVSVDLLGKDLIIGSKMAHWAEDLRPRSRNVVSKVFNLVLKVLFGFKGSDTHGIKAVRKAVIDKVYQNCHTVSGIFDTELVIKIQHEGYKIADFPVKVKEKRASRFPNRIWHTPRDIWDLYKSIRLSSTSNHEKEYFYDKIADNWEEVINNRETHKRLEIVFNNLLDDIDLKNKKFLEVGCGLGYFCERAASGGAKITGVDIGQKLVDKTQIRVPSGSFHARSGTDLKFENSQFDLVLCTEVIEHVVDQEKLIKELSRVVKKNGQVVITTPNKLFKPLFDLLSWLRIRPYQGNEIWLSFDELRDVAANHNLKAEKEIGFNFFYPTKALDYFEKYQFLHPFMINMGFRFKKLK